MYYLPLAMFFTITFKAFVSQHPEVQKDKIKNFKQKVMTILKHIASNKNDKSTVILYGLGINKIFKMFV